MCISSYVSLRCKKGDAEVQIQSIKTSQPKHTGGVQTYLHVFSLQHEFNNICYWFFDVCRKRLQEKEKKTQQLYFQICNSGKSPYSAFRQSLAPQLEDFNEGKHLPYLADGCEAREVKWFYLVASGKLQKHNPNSLGLNKWYIKQHLEEQWVGRRIHWSR